MDENKVTFVTRDFCEPVTTGERIKKYRKMAGLKQWELANKINRDREYISYWETGKRNVPDDDIEKLALLFGIQSTYLRLESEYPTYEEEKKAKQYAKLKDVIDTVSSRNDSDIKTYRLALTLLNLAGVKIEPVYRLPDEVDKVDRLAGHCFMLNYVFPASKISNEVVAGVYIDGYFLHGSEFTILARNIVNNAATYAKDTVLSVGEALTWRGYYINNANGQQIEPSQVSQLPKITDSLKWLVDTDFFSS